jgi:hypothetical protein
MDSGLNKNAGYFIKNFYQVALRPRALERELVAASVVSTVVFGLLIIAIALKFASWRHLTIFELMVNFGNWVALPISVPLIWGLFIRRAPGWAAWSAVVVGLTTSYLTNRLLTDERAGSFFGYTLNGREASDWATLAGSLMNIVVGSAWFLLASMVAPRRSVEERQRVDAFFAKMHTPVDFEREERSAGSDNVQARVMGMLCLLYGAFITLLVLIPNPLTGRLAFAFCGLVMFGIGWLLWRAGTRGRRRDLVELPVATVHVESYRTAAVVREEVVSK